MTSYKQLCRALDDARSKFAGYRSECVLFAAALSRGFVEYSGWPRDLVSYETSYESIAGPGGPSVTQKPDEDLFSVRDFGKWRQLGTDVVPWLCAGCIDVVRRMKQSWIIQTRCLDGEELGTTRRRRYERTAAVGAESPLHGVAAVPHHCELARRASDE